MSNLTSPNPDQPADSQRHREVLIDPITGERFFLHSRAEKLESDLEAKKTRGTPEGVWSSEQLAEELKIVRGTAQHIIKSLRHQADTVQSHVNYQGLQIPSEAIVTYTSDNGVSAYGIQKEWGEKIVEAYKAVKGETHGVPEGVWSSEELAEKLKMVRSTAQQIIKLLRRQADTGRSHVNYHGLKIPSEAIVTYTTERRTIAYGIHKEWGEKIVEAYKAVKGETRGIPEGVWSSEKLATGLRLVVTTAQQIIKVLRRQATTGQQYVNYRSLQIPSEAIVTYTTDNGVHAYGIQKEWGEKIVEAYKAVKGETRGIPEGIWSSEDFGTALGLSKSQVLVMFKSLRKQYTPGHPYAEYFELQIPSEALVIYTAENGGAAYGIQKEWGEKIVAAYKKVRGEDIHNKEGIWSPKELADALNLSKNSGYNILTALNLQYSDDQTHAEYLGLQIPKDAILRYPGKNNNIAFGISEEWGKKIVDAYKAEKGVKRGRPKAVWGREELAKAMDAASVTSRRIIRALRIEFSKGHDRINYLDLNVPKEAMVEYIPEGKGTPAYGITQEWGRKIAEAWKGKGSDKPSSAAHSEEHPRKERPEPRKSPAKMTAEERAENKRGSPGRDE